MSTPCLTPTSTNRRSEPAARLDVAVHRVREAINYRHAVGDKMARIKITDLEVMLSAIGARR